jgi:hypothetical protein
MSTITMSEEALQRHAVKYLRSYARRDIEWHHVPNGDERAPRVAKRLKDMGVVPGVADLMFLIDAKSIAVELKTEIGTQSAAQAEWQENHERAGGLYFIARGPVETMGVLRAINALHPKAPENFVSAASDASGVRERPWHKVRVRAASTTKPSPVKPRRAADPVFPNI